MQTLKSTTILPN